MPKINLSLSEKNTKKASASGFMLGLLLFAVPAWAGDSARELLDKSSEFTASAPYISRVDTTEQTAVLMKGSQRGGQQSQTNVITIDIDLPRQLARQIWTQQGQKIILLENGIVTLDRYTLYLKANDYRLTKHEDGLNMDGPRYARRIRLTVISA